jgi:hypothetical protein
MSKLKTIDSVDIQVKVLHKATWTLGVGHRTFTLFHVSDFIEPREAAAGALRSIKPAN